MGEGGDSLLLIRLETEMDRDWDKSDPDENDANQIAQWKATYEQQRQEHRYPNDHFTDIWLQ